MCGSVPSQALRARSGLSAASPRLRHDVGCGKCSISNANFGTGMDIYPNQSYNIIIALFTLSPQLRLHCSRREQHRQKQISMSCSSSSSDLSEDVRRHILSHLPSGSRIIATAPAKVYHMPFSERCGSWTYTGLSGTLVLGRNHSNSSSDATMSSGTDALLDRTFWFRLIHPLKGVVWLHQIPEEFQYSIDKPFFHIFAGKVSLIVYLLFMIDCLLP